MRRRSPLRWCGHAHVVFREFIRGGSNSNLSTGAEDITDAIFVQAEDILHHSPT